MKKNLFKLLAIPAAALIIGSAAAANTEGPAVPPADSVRMLQEGNARFAAGQAQHPRIDQSRIAETAGGQHPFAAVLGCADSRVPVETVFDQGIGDIFTVRVAGNVADTDEIGSLEYAVEHLGISAILVLGHTKCGAVTAVVKKAHVGGSLPGLLDRVKIAAGAAARENPKLKGDELVSKTIRANVWQSISDLMRKSKVIREAVAEGKLAIVGGLYDLSTGSVEFMGPHIDQDSLAPKKKASKEKKEH